MLRPDVVLSRRSFARSTVVVSAAALGIPASRAVLAQDATPVDGQGPGLPPPPEGATVIAEGLLNPRFLAFGDDGTLYITEAGVGGDEVPAPPEPASPAATSVGEEVSRPSARGYTGRISSVAPDGTQAVMVEGLASYGDVGPVGIALGPGEIYFAIGGVAVGAGYAPLPEENSVNRYVLDTGTVETIANLSAYEVENNPDGTDVNPNLYEIEMTPDGQLLVADAGGNTLYTVNPATGEFALTAVVPLLGQIPGAEDVPAEMTGRQPVPTGIASAPDGTTLIGLLSEGWPEGAPSVLILQEDATFASIPVTLAFNVGLAVGPDDQLYASQLFSVAEGSGETGPGSVVRIHEDGTVEPVLEGVMMPHGIAFDASGNLYVATNSLMSSPGFAAGQVIRVDGVAAV